MSRPVFPVHRDLQVNLSSQWLQDVPACDADWIEAEDLTAVSIESIYVIGRGVYFSCKRLKSFAAKALHWDLFEALDLSALHEGDLAETVLTLMLSCRDSVTLRLLIPIRVTLRDGLTATIDGVNWCQHSHHISVRTSGTNRWFSINELSNDVNSSRELMIEVAYSLRAATCEASA